MDTTIHVALLAEGVDRNGPWDGKYIVKQASPSSRRAWIEIAQKCCFWRFLRSPSSRRAWIEILPNISLIVRKVVALLAEGVDRNMWS